MRIELVREDTDLEAEPTLENEATNDGEVRHVQTALSIKTKAMLFCSGVTMLGAGIFLLYKYFTYPEYQQRKVNATATLSGELQDDITILQSQICSLIRNITELTPILDTAIETQFSLYFGTLSQTNYSWHCTPCIEYSGCCNTNYSIPAPTGWGVCSDRISLNQPYDHGAQDGGACQRFGGIPLCGPIVNISSDPCLSLFPSIVSAVNNVTMLDQKWDTSSFELAAAQESLSQTNSNLVQLYNYIKDDSEFYGALGDATTFYAIWLAFGEFAPAIIMLITLLKTCCGQQEAPDREVSYGALTEAVSPPSFMAARVNRGTNIAALPAPIFVRPNQASTTVLVDGKPSALAAIAAAPAAVPEVDAKVVALNTNQP